MYYIQSGPPLSVSPKRAQCIISHLDLPYQSPQRELNVLYPIWTSPISLPKESPMYYIPSGPPLSVSPKRAQCIISHLDLPYQSPQREPNVLYPIWTSPISLPKESPMYYIPSGPPISVSPKRAQCIISHLDLHYQSPQREPNVLYPIWTSPISLPKESPMYYISSGPPLSVSPKRAQCIISIWTSPISLPKESLMYYIPSGPPLSVSPKRAQCIISHLDLPYQNNQRYLNVLYPIWTTPIRITKENPMYYIPSGPPLSELPKRTQCIISHLDHPYQNYQREPNVLYPIWTTPIRITKENPMYYIPSGPPLSELPKRTQCIISHLDHPYQNYQREPNVLNLI